MFYIKIEVRSSLIFILLVIIVILSIAVTALKIRDILTYFLIPFILYMVCRPTSRFTVYKALFALIAVLTVKGVVLLIREVVLLVSIEWFNLLFLFTIHRDWGFNIINKANKSSSRLKTGWFISWYILVYSKELIVEYYIILKVFY